MKIIELLKIVADDVNVPPKKIKYNDRIFEYKLWLEPNKFAYVEKETNNTLEEYCCFYDLNDKVEIIEEDKKIEAINNFTSNVGAVDENNIEEYIHKLFEQEFILFSKINEIINYINNGDK